ncbi:MAG: amidophosphoribosyltransferase [Patescibacteria group bacterium]
MTKKFSSKQCSLQLKFCKEPGFNFRDLFPENCGLAAAINIPSASWVAGQLITVIEKRGEKGGGVVSQRQGKIYERRRVGPFSVQFRDFDEKRFRRELPGNMAIAHCRYATKGDPGLVANIQPLIVTESKYGPFAIAHNGTLVNVENLKAELKQSGCKFDATSDTEILIHLILSSGEKKIENAILYALDKVFCSYALLIITRDKIFAIRDRYGVRPLSVAKLGSGFMVCSETVSFDQFVGAEFLRDVAPGEMLIFEKKSEKFKSLIYARAEEFFCVFESIYFSNPRSKNKGIYNEDFRRKIGEQIVLENPELKGDLVVPILDSGKHFAQGLAHVLSTRLQVHNGDLYEEAFQRAHEPLGGQSRSFTATTTEERISVIRQKLHLKKEAIVGKEIIVVDDSIVRSHTAKIIVEMLQQAGAKKVIFCVCFPPIVNVCPNGMDFQTRTQLIAYKRSLEVIKQTIGADELIYLQPAGLYKVVAETYGGGICGGCFGGSYPELPKYIAE